LWSNDAHKKDVSIIISDIRFFLEHFLSFLDYPSTLPSVLSSPVVVSRTDLLEIFYFFKVYPTKRQMRLNYFGSHSTSHVMQRIKERARYLALCMTDVQIAFAQRFEATNVLPHLFPSFVTSVYDSFPIVVQRPRRRSLRRLVYCGKYKLCVLKAKLLDWEFPSFFFNSSVLSFSGDF